MIENNLLLAAFLVTHKVQVRKLGEDAFEFDLEENDPLVVQFSAPDGYNANINRVENVMYTLQSMDIDDVLKI